MGLLGSGVTMIDRFLGYAKGETVTYSRGVQSCTPTAVPAANDYQAVDGEGGTTLIHSLDWLLTAADLVLGGALAEPQPGDRIETAAGRIYEVLPVDGLHCFRYSDEPTNTRLRVHSKLVSA